MMSKIYNSALLVVIAAAGDNADAGLPGVRSGSRTQSQHVVQLSRFRVDFDTKDSQRVTEERSLNLMTTLRPQKLWYDEYLSGTTWYTRAWCMQERVLARRSLIFTAEQMYWECHGGSYCEESWFDFYLSRVTRHGDQLSLARSHLSDDESSKDTTSVARETRWQNYRDLVLRYSGLKLTNQNDIFNAFSGILSYLTDTTGQGFF